MHPHKDHRLRSTDMDPRLPYVSPPFKFLPEVYDVSHLSRSLDWADGTLQPMIFELRPLSEVSNVIRMN